MKKVVFEIDVESGEVFIDAQGFQGRQCDEVLKSVLSDIEEQQVTYKTGQEQKQKQEQTLLL